ncbi:MAG: prolipoprotein diacylglyceryl transferase [Lachnospiraceae bacterium]|nr:prolipoprotein diacylglyceryl transferase [Lachnospiraceae bacterium]
MGFHVGAFFIPYYGFFIALGVCAAALCGYVQVKLFHLDVNDFAIIASLVGLGGIVGAKILYLVVSWRQIDISRLLDWEYLNSIMVGGFVFYGGLLGGLFCLFLCARIWKLPVFRYVNVCMPCIPIVHGFGRIGCSLVGCCYGAAYEGPFAQVYENSFFAPNHVSLFPVQRTEALANLIIAAILLLYIDTQRSRRKSSLSIYLLLYAPVRFGLEYYRSDSRGALGSFSTSQWISIVLFLAALIYCGMNNRRDRTTGDIS